MSLVGRLAERDGALFVVYETHNFTEPVRVRLWWRVDRVVRDPYNGRSPEPGDVARSIGSNVWRCSREGEFSTGEVIFSGTTQAAYDERDPVPCPPVRRGVETRWRNGLWEKRLKKGWVPA